MCAPGSFCPAGSTAQTPCRAGYYGLSVGLSVATCTGMCARGNYCAAGSVYGSPLSWGPLIVQSVYNAVFYCTLPGRVRVNGSGIILLPFVVVGSLGIHVRTPTRALLVVVVVVVGGGGLPHSCVQSPAASILSRTVTRSDVSAYLESAGTPLLDDYAGTRIAGTLFFRGDGVSPGTALWFMYGLDSYTPAPVIVDACGGGNCSAPAVWVGGPTRCPAGRYGATLGATNASCDGLCAAGRVGGAAGQASALCTGPCPIGAYCITVRARTWAPSL